MALKRQKKEFCLHIIGQIWILTSMNTSKTASTANWKTKIRKNQHPCNLCQPVQHQTKEFTWIYLEQSNHPQTKTITFCVWLMLFRSMQKLSQFQTKKLKQLQWNFLKNGSADMEFHLRFTQMVVKNLSTNYQRNFAKNWKLPIQKTHLTTLNATHKLKCSTKQFKNIWHQL